MIAFVLVALFSAAAISALVALADSGVRGMNAHKQLRIAAKQRSVEQAVHVTIIEPAGLKAPMPFKLPVFNRSGRPAPANCLQPLPAAA